MEIWRRTSAEEELFSDARVLPTHVQWVEEWKKLFLVIIKESTAIFSSVRVVKAGFWPYSQMGN